MERDDILQTLEQTGLLRTLLLVSEKPRFVTELIRSSQNPEGIGSFKTVRRVRDRLLKLGLVEKEVDEGPPKTIYLKPTENGQRVVDLLQQMLDIIENE